MSGSIRSAVIGKKKLLNGKVKPIIPDHKVYFLPFDDFRYVHYVCGLINSQYVRRFIDGFTIKLQVGTLLRHIKLPKFDSQNQTHLKLSYYPYRLHQINRTAEDNTSAIKVLTNKIDKISWEILNA